MPDLRVAANEDELTERAAADVADAVRDVLAQGAKTFHLVLAGGNTPRKLYERLAAPPYDSSIPWQNVRVFWGDERFVPREHADSNYRMAKEALLDKVSIPPDNVHPVPTGLPTVQEAAAGYEKDLKYLFHVIPRFHLILLGLGEDGHTASLFPGAHALNEEKRWVLPIQDAPKPPPERVTITLPLINNAQQVLFLITGEKKAPVVRRILTEPIGRFPAQYVWPTSGSVVWWLDRAAYPG